MYAIVGSTLAFLISLRSLTFAPFPTGNALLLAYFAYVGATVICLHVVFFGVNYIRSTRTGKSFTRRVPRYVEYAYAVIISASLLQVFFASPHFADYISFFAGEETEILARIRNEAKRHVDDECTKIDTTYYSVPYCNKLRKILEIDDLKSYVYHTLMNDEEFLNHVVGKDIPEQALSRDLTSPIAIFVNQLRARAEYSATPINLVANNAFSWIGLLLLPIGIGLRLVKTSLELFAGLG